MPGDFLLTGSVTQLIGSTPSAEQLAALAGTEIVFTSNVPKNQAIPVSGGVMYVAARTAVVMSNGELSENGTDSGIRLLADDPALGLGNPLQWTINPARATIAGRPINLAKWTFNAPAAGDDTSLDDLTPVPTVEQTGNNVGPRGYPVDDVELVGSPTELDFTVTVVGDDVTLSTTTSTGPIQFKSHGENVGSPVNLLVTEIGFAGDIVSRSTSRATPELWTAFAGKADGAAPALFDSAQAAATTGSSTQTVSGGLLTCAVPGAGYYYGQLAGVATRIGARFVLIPGSTTNGVVAFAITDQRMNTPIPDMSCHLVIAAGGWAYGVWRGPNNGNLGLDVISSRQFATSLLIDGVTEYEAEVFISGNTATIQVRDGAGTVIVTDSITDSRIGNTTYSGPFVFFESAGSAGDNTAGFTHVWASSGTSKPATPRVPSWRSVKSATTTSSTTFGTANIPELPSDLVVAPPSGKVVARISCVVNCPTSANLFLKAAWGDGLTSSGIESQLVAVAQTGTQMVSAEFVITGLIPGHNYQIVPQAASTQSDSVVVINTGSSYHAYLVIEPVL